LGGLESTYFVHSDTIIHDTINLVNTYYRPIGLSFKIEGIKRIPSDNATVHGVERGNTVDRDIKSTYRQGGAAMLNIYTVGPPTSPFSSFPKDYQKDPIGDGIVYSYEYLPGGNVTGFNTGNILAHEIGHWVGLYHTFQNVSFWIYLNGSNV
jgi:hypothetical protein